MLDGRGLHQFASSETMQYLFEGTGNPHAGSMRGYQRLVESGKEEPITHADHYHTNFAYDAAYSKECVLKSTVYHMKKYLIACYVIMKNGN